ncbi:MAG TPA: beta-propeller fold lactonase family protein [Vicinamibacterales bacterium]|nr:beta-propeller fold lactonase family protein [Vicinamibacterales bacterium]
MVLLTLAAVLITGYSVSSTQLFRPINFSGRAKLVSVEPLPAESAMCPWEPAAVGEVAPALLPASYALARAQGAASAIPLMGAAIDFSQRKPIRTIKDPYAAYSAVAVDPVNNEVVLTDENLFQILVYDRTASTPPAAKMTEPKRMIGGLQTKIEFQCGLYIDPTSGDIYAVNNDTVNTLVIFNRSAKGNVPPTRELYTPHGTFGIAVDEGAQEMFLTIQHDNAVVVYPKYATKDDAPVRLLQGAKTQMADPHGIAIDTKNNLMFVSNYGNYHAKAEGGASSGGREKANWPTTAEVAGSGKFFPPSITVYSLKASGDVAPLRVITGPKTGMNWPAHLAVDEDRGELYVANDMGDAVIVFSTNANGDAAPIRVLKGPKTLIKNPTGVFLDKKNNELWVASFGNHAATVFKRDAAGDTAPLRVIRSGPLGEAALGIGNPHPITYDTKREEIIVPN